MFLGFFLYISAKEEGINKVICMKRFSFTVKKKEDILTLILVYVICFDVFFVAKATQSLSQLVSQFQFHISINSYEKVRLHNYDVRSAKSRYVSTYIYLYILNVLIG